MPSSDTPGMAFLTGAAVTVVLGVAGIMMLSEPPNDADAAVGKGLLVLALCSAIVSVALLAYAVSSSHPERSGWRDRDA